MPARHVSVQQLLSFAQVPLKMEIYECKFEALSIVDVIDLILLVGEKNEPFGTLAPDLFSTKKHKSPDFLITKFCSIYPQSFYPMSKRMGAA